MSEPGSIDSADPGLCPLAGGKLLAEITNRIVSLVREHYGRGPIKAKTYVLDNLVVCVLTDSGFTAIERTMMGGGEPERVLEMRRDFQRMMKVRYSEMIEELTAARCSRSLARPTSSPTSRSRCSSWTGRWPASARLNLSTPATANSVGARPRTDSVLR